MKTRFFAAALVAQLMISGAWAQGATSTGGQDAMTLHDDGMGEIVVTAQKRAESIQNVPLSISAVSGVTLARTGISDAFALQKLLPSLELTNNVVGAGVAVRIRGFGTPGNAATDSEVATYLDSVFIPRPGAAVSSFLDVKSIEVLSGPQGTLFGRNATAGAISVNTNVPSTRGLSLDMTGEASRFGGMAGTAVLNVPVSSTFAFRLAGRADHTDGIYRNRLDGETYGKSSGLMGRLSAKWDVTPDISWTARADLSRTVGHGVNPDTVYVRTASAAQLAAFSAFIARNGGTPPVYSARPSYDFNLRLQGADQFDRQYGVSSDLSWTISPILTVRLINSYRRWYNNQLTPDLFATSLDMITDRLITRSRSSSHELQLISSRDALLDGRFGFTAGLYYFTESFDQSNAYSIGADFCQARFGTLAPLSVAPCRVGAQSYTSVAPFTQSTDSYAGYIQANYAILPRLQLDLGFRKTFDRKRGTYEQIVYNRFGSIIVPEGPHRLRFKDSKPSVRASLSWQVNDDVMAFATFSTGYKSGGFNSGISVTALTPGVRTFVSETVQDYEIGVKSTFANGRVRFNVTGFNTNLKNFQDRSFNGQSFVIRNSGNARARGVDMETRVGLTSGFSLSGSMTFLNSVFTENPSAPGFEGCTGAAGCPLVQNLTGARLQYAPRWKGTAAVEWRSQPIGDGYVISASARENFKSSIRGTNTNNPQNRIPGYRTTDLTLGISAPGDVWRVDLFGTNIFDKRYLTSVFAQPLAALAPGVNDPATGATLFRGLIGDPARYGIRVSARF